MFCPTISRPSLITLNKPLPMDGFTLGIVDDVTFTSLPPRQQTLAVSHAGITACKFWGMGSDGTVGANKARSKLSAIKHRSTRRPTFPVTRKNPAALPFHILRFGDRPINSPYLIHRADLSPVRSSPTLSATICWTD